MRSTLPSVLAMILGWIVILAIPITFFAFGWKDIELRCQRTAIGALASCSISESFAMGLYTRKISAREIVHIGYRTRSVKQVSTKTGFINVQSSTIIFDTKNGEVQIGHVTSAIDNSTERELILKTRTFLNTAEARNFVHKSNLHSVFGYLGLVGTAGLLLIFFSVLWHHLRKTLTKI